MIFYEVVQKTRFIKGEIRFGCLRRARAVVLLNFSLETCALRESAEETISKGSFLGAVCIVFVSLFFFFLAPGISSRDYLCYATFIN